MFNLIIMYVIINILLIFLFIVSKADVVVNGFSIFDSDDDNSNNNNNNNTMLIDSSNNNNNNNEINIINNNISIINNNEIKNPQAKRMKFEEVIEEEEEIKEFNTNISKKRNIPNEVINSLDNSINSSNIMEINSSLIINNKLSLETNQNLTTIGKIKKKTLDIKEDNNIDRKELNNIIIENDLFHYSGLLDNDDWNPKLQTDNKTCKKWLLNNFSYTKNQTIALKISVPGASIGWAINLGIFNNFLFHIISYLLLFYYIILLNRSGE